MPHPSTRARGCAQAPAAGPIVGRALIGHAPQGPLRSLRQTMPKQRADSGEGPAGPDRLFGAVTGRCPHCWPRPGCCRASLLLAGRLSAWPMVFMFAPLAAGLCYFAVRQLPASWPTFPRPEPRPKTTKPKQSPGQDAANRHGRHRRSLHRLAARRRTEQIIYLRDPPPTSRSPTGSRITATFPFPIRRPRSAARTRAWASPAPPTTRAAPASCRSS